LRQNCNLWWVFHIHHNHMLCPILPFCIVL
jgi:hypothetical protein